MLNTENPLLLHLNKKTGPKKVVSVIAEILFFGNEIYATKENQSDHCCHHFFLQIFLSHPMHLYCFSEVLSSKIFGELNKKQTEYINDIYTSGVHLLGMINEILDISKIESNAMRISYTNFLPNNAINEVLSVMKPLANKKSINIIFDSSSDKEVSLDYQKFQQILYNILSNAIKFTPNNGQIQITLKENNKKIILSVKDNGNGIDKASQEKIFEKFVQLENTYTKTGSSTGLGLTITKKFVEMMNGEIKLESDTGKGANFIITLPTEKENG